MQRFRVTMTFLVCLALGTGVYGDKKKEKKDPNKEALKELQGVWQAIEIRADGSKSPGAKQLRYIIKGNNLTIRQKKADGTGTRVFKHTIRIYPGSTPKEFDITIGTKDGKEYGKSKGKKIIVTGIYKFDELNRLVICTRNRSQTGKDLDQRPLTFKTKPRDGLETVVLERVVLDDGATDEP